MNKVSDDKRPMVWTWYRSTIDPQVMGKVLDLSPNGNIVSMMITGGQEVTCTVNEFADGWELS